jgi:hypothetical protein
VAGTSGRVRFAPGPVGDLALCTGTVRHLGLPDRVGPSTDPTPAIGLTPPHSTTGVEA